jgi:hypothetical protein
VKLEKPLLDTAHTIERKVRNVRHRTDCLSRCLQDLKSSVSHTLPSTTWTTP